MTLPVWYDQMHQTLRAMPACVGFHLCGAYLKNRCRRRGLRDEQERPDAEAIQAITQTNRATTEWMHRAAEAWEQTPKLPES
jgi:hypothetical protein